MVCCSEVVKGKFNRLPFLLTHPICFAGFPTTRAKGLTSFITTVPAPTKEYLPSSVPQSIVALAPIDHANIMISQCVRSVDHVSRAKG